MTKFIIGIGVAALLGASSALAQENSPAFYGSATASIASGVVIPAGRSVLWASGATPGVLNRDAPADSPERFGDTKAQARSIFEKLAGQLKEQGVSMKDVVYIRAYLAPDPKNNGRIDTVGWNAAYGEFFGTAANPTKPARSTVGVAQLVGVTQLIEVEVFAVVPEKH